MRTLYERGKSENRGNCHACRMQMRMHAPPYLQSYVHYCCYMFHFQCFNVIERIEDIIKHHSFNKRLQGYHTIQDSSFIMIPPRNQNRFSYYKKLQHILLICTLLVVLLLLLIPSNNHHRRLMFPVASALTLVSDLPTPSFLIDMDMLHKASPKALPLSPLTSSSSSSSSEFLQRMYPSLLLPKYDTTLFPIDIVKTTNGDFNIDIDIDASSSTTTPTRTTKIPRTLISSSMEANPYNVRNYGGQSALGYIHASVSQSKSSHIADMKISMAEDDPVPMGASSFLAEIDLPYTLGIHSQLVMGINNHHVGGYYWARSAGMGASMEAPGIAFRPSGGEIENNENHMDMEKNGMLCWEGTGPLDCNSNDGKRSEWVNFVKVGDSVQLLPDCLEDCIMGFLEMDLDQDPDLDRDLNSTTDEDSLCKYHIYGFSSRGRPLGSEPIVICQWKVV